MQYQLILLAFAVPVTGFAQLPSSDLSLISPHSAKRGVTVEMTLTGENLDDTRSLQFTHPGISAEPMMLPAVKDQPAKPAPLKFNVTIPTEVSPATYEVRAVGAFGISTARPFLVVDEHSHEISETSDHANIERAMPVETNSVVSGFVDARNIDWYKINVTAGQRILVELNAQRLDSRMDGMIIAYDAKGRRLAENRDWYGRDSFLEICRQEPGEVFLAVSDILYRGGPEYFYRLTVSDQPHIDFVFPPAGLPGSRSQYRIYGRNLANGSRSESVERNGQPLESIDVEIELPSEPQLVNDFYSGTPRQGILPSYVYQLANSNPIRIGFATAPLTMEDSSNDFQDIVIPTEIMGRFDRTNDEDSFRFTLTAGQTVCVETIADRMESTVDPFLVIHRIEQTESGEKRTKIAENDDMTSFFSADECDTLNADTCDAAICFTAEQAGVYSVTISNQFGEGESAQLYRLAIRQPTPDFQLIASTERPLATNRAGYSVAPLLRQGAKWGVRIVAPRQDGFTGDIVVTAEGLPPSVTAQPLTLSGSTDRGYLVLSAATNASAWAGAIRIVGRAKVGDRELNRPAKFASLVWGHAFADSIQVRSRLNLEIPLAVIEHEQAPIILGVAEDREWTVAVGKSLEIPVTVPTLASRIGDLTVEPRGLFGMLRSPPTLNIGEQATEGKLTINFTPNGNFQVQPGRYQFALHGTGMTKYKRKESGSDKVNEKDEKFAAWSELITVRVDQ